MVVLSGAFLLFCVYLVQISAKALDNEQLYPLHIVHYNDFHARFEETSVLYPVCTKNDTSCLGGFARLYQEIKTLLKQYPDSLLLNAGDTFQGTYWYSLLKWNVTLQFINTLPNDAHAIGNHEFDDGIAGLAPYLAALHGPVVAANLDTSKEPLLNDLYQPHVIVKKKGRKIGIIGLITTETATSSNPDNAIFLDPIPVVQREAQALTEKGVDIIIVLSHCGLNVDKEIARTAGENIDIIVGGHSHSLLWNGTSPSNEDVSGPYPVMIETESRTGHKVLIVTASAFTKYLGNITTYFDKHGDLQSFDGTPVFLNRSIPEDPEIKALLRPYTEHLHRVVGEVIGYSSDSLPLEPCSFHECALGNLIADALLNETRHKYPTNLTSLSFVLRNNIRGSMPKGDITRGDVINTQPFSNKAVSFELAGRYILEALKRCLTTNWELHPFSGPWLPHVSGLRVTLNTTSRQVVSVLVKEENEYRPLDLDKDYQICTLDFLMKGGSGFTMFRDHKKNVQLLDKNSQLLENYIKHVSPITPPTMLDKRLIVLQ